MTKQIFAGASARKWRRGLAAGAERCDATMRTLKFPLEVGPHPAWSTVQSLSGAVSSDGPGSLIHVLYTLLLNGWRVFGKQAQAVAFRNQRVMDDASWAATVCDSSGLTLAKEAFIPSVIYQRILIAPRSTGTKDVGFKPETVAVEYAKNFCGGKSGDKIPEIERDLFARVGQALCDRFASWKDLTANPAVAGKAFDDVVSDLGWTTPAIPLEARIASISAPAIESTIGFEPGAPIYADAGAVAINLIVSRALQTARQSGLTEKKELVRAAQEFVTGDPNHGGLAWPFGRKGMTYFRDTPAEQIASDFDLPSADPAKKVVEAMKAVPPIEQSFLGDTTYADYRSAIGGVLTSWIANYISRLDELDETLTLDILPVMLPQALLNDAHLFEEVGTTPQEISDMADRALEDRDGAQQALDRLYGRGEQASVADIEIIERYSTLLFTLSGVLASLLERINREHSAAESRGDKETATVLEACLFKVPSWISPLQKLNRLDLSVKDPQAVIAEAARRFSVLHDAMHVHYTRIRVWAEKTGQTLSPLARLAARENGYARNKGRVRNPDEQAFRNCVDIVGRAARKCTDRTLRQVAGFYLSQKLFSDDSDCNKFFFNRQGFLYKSTFSTTPRSPFAINRDALGRAQAFLDALEVFLTDLRSEVFATDKLELVRVMDLYRLERAHFAMLMNGFPDIMPSSLALVPEVADTFNLPEIIRLRIGETNVSSPTMRKIFNHYYIELEALAAILLRPSFFLRAKFSRAGDNALIYAPDGDFWAAPDRLYGTQKPIGSIMRRLESAGGGRIPVDPVTALSYLADTSESMEGDDVRAYMRQAPHAWFYPWPGGVPVHGLMASKAGMGKKTINTAGSRLVGAPSFKGVLDTALTHPDAVSLSDASIIFDQVFTQTAHRTPDGRIEVAIAESGASMQLALPAKEMPLAKVAPAFENFVAIDLGEHGLAYAVFNVESRELVERGRVKVKSIRRLVADDRAGRRRVSAVNKFRATFDRAEERRRDNIVGDFCTAINRLMWFYKAFPILEYAPGGASGSIDKVYKAITERYLPTQTPTVDAERRGYWAGASFWRHPTLMQAKFNKQTGRRAGAPEPLTLFPGAGVSEYGTSQQCSCCGRNPIDGLISLRKGGVKHIHVGEGGAITLDNGTIILRAAGNAPKSRSSGRAPLASEAHTGEQRIDEVIALARRNLRQAPASRQVRDTMQSRYQCLYTDCNASHHADENAAVNIGKKFIADRIISA